jgi:hypothetical protein
MDIAVAMTNRRIMGFAFSGSRGTWFSSTLYDLSTESATKIRVGDVDGDGWDDLVIISDTNFNIMWIRNKRGNGFDQTTIDTVGDSIRDFDIGDVDRGVMATYARF